MYTSNANQIEIQAWFLQVFIRMYICTMTACYLCASTYDDVTYVYDDVTYVYDDVTYVYACYLCASTRI